MITLFTHKSSKLGIMSSARLTVHSTLKPPTLFSTPKIGADTGLMLICLNIYRSEEAIFSWLHLRWNRLMVSVALGSLQSLSHAESPRYSEWRVSGWPLKNIMTSCSYDFFFSLTATPTVSFLHVSKGGRRTLLLLLSWSKITLK